MRYMFRELALPPRIKVLEAAGAVADGRVHVLSPSRAEVLSSDGTRKYTVFVSGDNVFSSDNGTRFRGYVGYPIIAFLMVKGDLPYDERVGRALAGIPWRKWNEVFKSYSRTWREAVNAAKERGVNEDEINAFVDKVFSSMSVRRFVYTEGQTSLF